jgi:WhiB family redox-sensing transcriptional regulator
MATPLGDWAERAACRRRPPEVFFPGNRGREYLAALAVCAACPVREPCLAYALQCGHDLHGVWGGTTHKQRLAMLGARFTSQQRARERMLRNLRNGRRHCGRCGRTLPLSAFSPKPSDASGLDSWCRPCKAADARDRRAARKAAVA